MTFINKHLLCACLSLPMLTAVPAFAATYGSGNYGNDNYTEQNNTSQYHGNNWYAGLSGDLTWLRHSSMGGGGNVNLGYRFIPGQYGDFRVEAEIGYHAASGSSGYGSQHYFTYMGNVYYDMTNWKSLAISGFQITPYIGAGIGDATISGGSHHTVSNFRSQFVNFSQHNNSFAYQGMAGLTLVTDSMPNTDWWLGYRYQGASKHHNQERLSSNNIELGVRFNF